MLRKMMIALLATAAVAMLAPDVASAQRGFGGGGGGGFRGRRLWWRRWLPWRRVRWRRWLPWSRDRWWRWLPCSRHRWWRLSCGPDGRRLSYGPDGRRLSCGPDGRRLSYSRNWRRWVPFSRNWREWFPSSRHWCRHWLPHRSDRWTRRDWPWRRRRVRSIRKRGARSISPRPLSPPTPPAANLRDDRIWPRTVRSLPLLRRLLSVRLQ